MKIVISEKMYVGYNMRGIKDDTTKLGFATYLPLDDTNKQQKAFDKRKSTVDSWSSGRGWKQNEDNPKPEIIDNVLLEGFKMAREVRRHGWGSGNVLWRIEDPRGFELEISSANMASIMSCSTLINGVIEGKCKWGWGLAGGSRVVLLPEKSEPYQNAVKSTELETRKQIPIKEVQIGDKVSLKNETVGIYCGSLHCIKYDYLEGNYKGYAWVPSKRRTHFFLLEDGTVYSMSTPKVALVTPTNLSGGSVEDGAEIINAKIREGANITAANGYAYTVLVSASVIKIQELSISTELSDLKYDDIKDYTRYSGRQKYPIFLEHSKCKDSLLRYEGFSYHNKGQVDLSQVNKSALLNENRYEYIQENKRQHYHNRYYTNVTISMTAEEIAESRIYEMKLNFRDNKYIPRIY